MFIRRSLSSLVALAVALSLAPRGTAATATPAEQGSSDQQLYQAYSEFFFLKRDMDFTLEMSMRESFLAWLYEGINVEASLRSREDPIGTLKALTPPELAGLDEESYAYPDDLEGAPLRVRYLANEQYQKTEFNHKYLQARLIKDKLIGTATSEQRKRMFKNDLESVLIAFRDGDYRNVILRCDELTDAYGYTDVSDVAFYRAESYLTLQIYDQAEIDYQYVLDNSSESWYRLRSLEKLISLAGDKGAIERVKSLWSAYEAEVAGNYDETYWDLSYRTDLYLMSGSDWKGAQAHFDAIPAQNSKYYSAQLSSADCSMAMVELDDAQKRYDDFLTPQKGKKITDDQISEALLKLGYIDYLQGKFDVAFQTFDQIQGEGPTYEQAQLSAIWCLYRLSAYQQVIDRANAFIMDYPKSQFYYEARSLIGFSEEMLGRGETALDNYRVVMSDLDDRQDFIDFNHELGSINESLAKLQELEDQLFIGGERDLFPEYLHLHREFQKLIDGVRFARALKTTPLLKDAINDQKDLMGVFQSQSDLEDKIYESQDAKLLSEYQKSIGRLTEIGSELSAGIRYYMSQKSLIQREQDQLYENIVGDSLKAQLEREWEATRDAMTMVRKYIGRNLSSSDPQTLVELSSVETDLTGIQDRILRVQRSLRKFGHDIVVSNLDTWSDFAYQRYTYGGLNFDFLYSKEHRVEELDEYIQQIGEILQSREAARSDTISLAAELVPAGKPGDPPYFAPPVPMWGMSVPASPMSDDTGPGEMVQPSDGSDIVPSDMAEPDSAGLIQPETESGVPTEEMESEPPATDETPISPDSDSPDGTMETSPDSQDGTSEEVEQAEPESTDDPTPGLEEGDATEQEENTIPVEENSEAGIDMTQPDEDVPSEQLDSKPEVIPEDINSAMDTLDTVAPDSLGSDTTGTVAPDDGGSTDPQSGPTVP